MKLNKKNKILLLGFALVIYLSYSLAILNTISYYRQYKAQKEILDNTGDYPRQLADLELRERQINRWISEHSLTSSSYQNELLKVLSHYCEIYNLKIVEFKEPHKFNEKENTITSYVFSLEGDFNNVLKILNRIENNSQIGPVKSLSASKKQNYKTNSEYVVTEIVLQKSESTTK